MRRSPTNPLTAKRMILSGFDIDPIQIHQEGLDHILRQAHGKEEIPDEISV